MGSGQSKFYRVQQQNQQYSFNPPPPPQHAYPGQYPPFMPQYGQMGYGQQMYSQPPQQGFIPPGLYGQGAHLPPPQLNWLPHDKQRTKRKSRRRESERFVGGFGPTGGQQSEAPRRAHSESQHRPMAMPEPAVIPAEMSRQPSNRRERSRSPPRVSTPFIPNLRRSHNDQDDEDRPRGGTSEHARAPPRHVYETPPPVEGTLADAIRPMEPASSAAFGPTGPRPRTPLSNPLPPPPRDLYEMTPYRSLLTLPQTTALLTATYGPQAGGGVNRANTITIQPAASVKKKKSVKGLFRAFSKKEKKPEQPHVQFIPVFVPANSANNTNGGQQSANQSQSHLPQSHRQSVQFQSQAPQPADLSRSVSHHSRRPSINVDPHLANNAPISPVRTSGHSSQQSGSPIPPIPPIPSSPPAIRFDQDGQYNVFMNHSHHRVVYQGKIYPTALHLHEAMKFIGHRDDIAEQIRMRDIWDVYPLAAQFQQDVRPDWNDRYLEFMEDVLLLKFTQHPDLRIKLLGTGTSRLIYSDPDDIFWGSGPNDTGTNELGKALVRVRDKLRQENVNTMYS